MADATPTPGETAYTAYCHYCAGRTNAQLPPWTSRTIDDQAAWEAAAQAVRAGSVVIDRGVFEHLLNCLANQKFLHEMPEADRFALQCVIDAAWVQGMDFLHGPPRIVDSYQEGDEGA